MTVGVEREAIVADDGMAEGAGEEPRFALLPRLGDRLGDAFGDPVRHSAGVMTSPPGGS